MERKKKLEDLSWGKKVGAKLFVAGNQVSVAEGAQAMQKRSIAVFGESPEAWGVYKTKQHVVQRRRG